MSHFILNYSQLHIQIISECLHIFKRFFYIILYIVSIPRKWVFTGYSLIVHKAALTLDEGIAAEVLSFIKYRVHLCLTQSTTSKWELHFWRNSTIDLAKSVLWIHIPTTMNNTTFITGFGTAYCFFPEENWWLAK